MTISPIGLMDVQAGEDDVLNTSATEILVEEFTQQKTSSEQYAPVNGIIGQGQCGEEAYWKLDGAGRMTISGTGAIWPMESEDSYYFVTGEECPWKDYKSQIISVEFEEGITNVNDGAFLNCENLLEVTFSETITRIGQLAFAKCENLKKIDLPDKVVTLEWRAFDGCNSIEEVTIPSTVVSFTNYVFYNCKSLKAVYIEGDVTRSVDEYNYMGTFIHKCSALERIDVAEEHVYLKSVDGVVYTKDGTSLLDYPGGKKDKIYEIVSGTRTLGFYALDNNMYLERVIIPDTVYNMGSSNFEDLANLKELTIPSTVESIGSLGYGCDSLYKITNESKVEISIGSWEGDLWVDEAGERVEKLVPNSSVYHRAEIWDAKLPTYMEVENGKSQKLLCKPVYFIEGHTFADVTDVKFSSSDESILTIDENGVMTGKKVGTVTIKAEPLYNRGRWRGGTVTCKVSVKEGNDLTSVVVDDVVFSLNVDGTAVLTDGRWSSSNYTVPEKVNCAGKKYTVTTIAKKAFYERTDLQSIVMADTITKIEGKVYEGTFYNCVNLKEITFSKNLIEIGKYVFDNCTGLTEVTLPDKLEVIAEGGFYKTGLTSVEIPASVRVIGQNAFLGTQLRTFYLPATVTDFHFLALCSISTLESIEVEKGQPEYESVDGVLYMNGQSGFGLCIYPAARKCDVYELDARAKAMYTGSINGVKLKKLIFPANMPQEHITSLQYAEVEAVEVADGAKYLMAKDGVLYSKDGKNLILYPTTKKDKIFFVPSGVENVRTFVDCVYLEEIYYPASVNKISGVYYSYAVEKVVFADDIQLEELKDYCFQGSVALKSICLPRTIKTFSNTWYGNEFLDCKQMKTLYIPKEAPFYTEAVWGSQTLASCDVATIYGYGEDNKVTELAARFGRDYVDVSAGYEGVLGISFAGTTIYLQSGKSKNVDADYAGLAKNAYGWWYVKNGKLDTTYTGLAKNAYGWWYVKNGKLDTTYTGMAKNEYGWFYVKKGKLDTTYTGLSQNEYGQWYMKNGKLDKNANGMVKANGSWYYVKNGKLDTTYTGMAKNQYGWSYMKNGKLDTTYTGMSRNQYGWFYMKNGKLDTTYTGMSRNQYGWFYMKNGKLDTTYTGMSRNQYGWFYMKNGELDTTYTGLAKNAYGQWYMKKGELDTTFTGIYTYGGVRYTIVNGKVMDK